MGQRMNRDREHTRDRRGETPQGKGLRRVGLGIARKVCRSQLEDRSAMSNVLDRYIRRMETYLALDDTADRAVKAGGRVTHNPKVATVVSGTVLGHPLHPILTDLPIGFWTSAMALDVAGGMRSRRGAKRLSDWACFLRYRLQ